MERVFVLTDGTYLRKAGGNLTLVRGGRVVDQVALDGLKQVTLMGYTSLSGAVLKALARARVETVLLSPKGRFEARLVVDEHKNNQRRKNQILKLADRGFSLGGARSIVRAKLRHQARMLALRGGRYSDDGLTGAAAAIRALERSVEGVGKDHDIVRGLEGHGSNIYFQLFPRLLRNDRFFFNGRNRRPPRDPVNALLSYVYTLLHAEVQSAIQRVGLDPAFGCLHEDAYGRPSLACDLVEEWRVFLADRFVLGLINRKVISPDDFVYRDMAKKAYVDEEDLKTSRPVQMKPAVSRALVQALDSWLETRVQMPGKEFRTTYRGAILEQVREFDRFLQGENESYAPFAWDKVR